MWSLFSVMLDVPSLRNKRPSARSISSLSLSKEKVASNESIDLETTQEYEPHQLQQLGILGSGTGGVVTKVLHLPSNIMMACKILKIIQGDDDISDVQMKRELEILKRCNSINIVKLYGSFVESGQISMLLEYVDLGSLDGIIKKYGPIPEEQVSCIAAQILNALQYLEENHKIVHRDVKPSNMLLSSQGVVKLSDFGVSKISQDSALKSFVGTMLYLAVSIINDSQSGYYIRRKQPRLQIFGVLACP
jgi:serine/threonine protein kinase